MRVAPGRTFTHWLVYGLSPGVSSLAAVPAAQGWKAGPGRRVTVRSVVAFSAAAGLAAENGNGRR